MHMHKILFYPVDNGDTTLFHLSDKTTILIDCKLRVKATDPNDSTIFDVKSDLLKRVQRRNGGIPYLDVFILTHPDMDHCLGFSKNFYQGDPSLYSKANLDREEIMIDELFVTSMLMVREQSGDAHSIRYEANRRIRLWNADDPAKDLPGNRISMIGYNGKERYEKVPSSVPGQLIPLFNGKELSDTFEMFIHAPFKDDLVIGKSDGDRNMTSIVFNALFKVDGIVKGQVLMGGDADHFNWEMILKKSKKHGNERYLKFDVFLSPHHCSWTFFNSVPYAKSTTPKATSLEVLDYRNENAYIIASCKKISDEDSNPPHYAAKEEYVAKVRPAWFLNTAIEPSEKKPEPIVFEVDAKGIKRKATDSAIRTHLANIANTGSIKPHCDEK
jgi:hypothetical protein